MMVEAVQKAVNPVLREFDVPGNVKIGVGIDSGYVVVTRIGLQNAFDITAYGDAINNSAKLCNVGQDEVLISNGARKMIPTVKGGKLVVDAAPTGAKITSGTPMLPSAYDNIRG